MKVTIWSILDEETLSKAKFNHLEDGWSEEEKPLPVKPEYTNQTAWQNHPWQKELGWLIEEKVVRKDNITAEQKSCYEKV